MTHSRTGFRNRFACWLSTVVFTALWPVAAIAQAMPKADFDIPPQRLDTALQQVAQVQRVQILFSQNDVKGLETSGVKGKLSTYEAVQKLIEGTGLSAIANQNNAIAVRPKPANEIGGQTENPTVLAQAQSAERQEATTNPSERKPVQLEGIRVTAQKREERLMDVPASVGVVTQSEIERRRLINAEDYLRGMPGVNQVEGYTGQSITIRGIESSLYYQNFFTGTTVATYFGETPTTNSAGTGGGTNVDIKLVDIERVEVLRGPQGTAFGSSSMGGTVRTIPVAPKLDRFEGKAVASYSTTARYGGDNDMVQGVLNIPLVQDKFAVRATAYHFLDSGFYRNRTTTDAAFLALMAPHHVQAFIEDKDGIGRYDVVGGRFAARYQASNDLQFTLSFLTQQNRTDGSPVANNGLYQQSGLEVAPQHRIRGQDLGRTDMDIAIANAVMEYDFGWASLLATYSHTKSEVGVSFSRTIVLGDNNPWSQNNHSDHREDVGEIRLVTHLAGPWNFIGGLYAEKLKDVAWFDNYWFGDPSRDIFGPNPNIGFRDDRRTLKQKAAFGEASWEFLRGLVLTGGVRTYSFERTFVVNTAGRAYAGAAADNKNDATGETYRANLSFRPTDGVLGYGSFAQGFRLGQNQIGLPPGSCDPNGTGFVAGTNIPIDSTRRINSDKVNSYEIGSKLELLDRRLSLSADAFRMDWSGMPVNVIPGSSAPTCQLTYIANAGKARSSGIEIEAIYQVSNSFRVDFGGSWIHARLLEDVPAVGAKAGNRLPGSPEVNAKLGMQYEFGVGGYRPFVRLDTVYVGTFYGDLLESPVTKAGGYTKLDASAGVRIGKTSIDLFVRNLTNEDAFTFRNASSGGAPARVAQFFGYQLRPRTIGVQIGYVF